MPIRPYLLIYRKRLLYCIGVAIFAALLMLFWTTAESPTDVGILWHHFCGCPPDPLDTVVLLNISTFTCSTIAIILGTGIGIGNQVQPGALPGRNDMRMLFTRPTTRIHILLTPLLIAGAAIALLPAVGLLILVGWLKLVHAPALGHLVDLARLVPSAAHLEHDATLLQVASAAHLPAHYVASVSVGLCAYAVFYSQRWWMLSENKWIRFAAAFPFVILFVPAMQFFSRTLGAVVLMSPPRLSSLDYVPSPPLVALHFAFAAAWIYSCWRIVRNAEI